MSHSSAGLRAPIRSKSFRWMRWSLAVVAVLAALVFVVPALSGTSTYFNGTMGAGQSASSGFNYWVSNSVSFSGGTFAVWMTDTSGNVYNYTSGSGGFIQIGSSGYRNAHCQNVGTGSHTATCTAST
jgi:hypothetical protein